MAHRHFHAHRHAAVHHEERNAWDTVTSRIGGIFQEAEAEPTTVVKTVYTTMAPKGYTGALTTLGGNGDSDTKKTADSNNTPTKAATDKTTTATATAAAKETTTSATRAATKAAAAHTDDSSSTATSSTKTAAQKHQTTETAATASSQSSSIDATTAAATDSVLQVDTLSHTTMRTTSAPSQPTLAASASGTNAAASASSTAGADSSSGGTSAGAKAGIAIGVLGGLFVVCMLVYFLFRKRQKQAESQRLADDEKLHGPYGSQGAATGLGTAATARSVAPAAGQQGSFFDSGSSPANRTSFAPRLSLRPVTQFLPNWVGGGATMGAAAGAGAVAGAVAGGAAVAASNNNSNQNLAPTSAAYPDRRTSRGPAIALQDTSPLSARAPGGSAWERGQANGPANPFGDTAKRVDPFAHPNDSTANLSQSPPSSTHSSDFGSALSSPTNDSPVGAGAGAAAAAAGAAAAGAAAGAAPSSLMRKTSIRKDGPKALDLTLAPPTMGTSLGPVPPSPSGTEFSVHSTSSDLSSSIPSASAAAIAAAGGPAVSTVHRVQLDFKPTLEDEMELRAGQLVRLLHEYDDGWALCIRLDRSQQGVVPRTCLSTRPVKPRPAPGGGRRGRPMTPQNGRGPNGRPMGPPPNGRPPMGGPPRPQSPGPRYQGGRPQSPAGGRPQSPGPRYQGGRPQSPAGGRPQSPAGGRRVTPPGPSAMGQQQQQQRRPSGTQSIGRKPVPGQAY